MGKVWTLRLPASGSDLRFVELDTHILDRWNALDTDATTARLEKGLGHVPDLSEFDRKRTDLRYIHLFDGDYGARTLSRGDSEGRYYIYKCVEPTPSGLRRNFYFENVEKARVYGDAFVFEVRKWHYVDGEWRASFGNMRDFEYDLKNGGTCVRLLKKMGTW